MIDRLAFLQLRSPGRNIHGRCCDNNVIYTYTFVLPARIVSRYRPKMHRHSCLTFDSCAEYLRDNVLSLQRQLPPIQINRDVTHLVIHEKESWELLPGCPFLDTLAYDDVTSDDSVAEDRRRKRTKVEIRNMLIFEDEWPWFWSECLLYRFVTVTTLERPWIYCPRAFGIVTCNILIVSRRSNAFLVTHCPFYRQDDARALQLRLVLLQRCFATISRETLADKIYSAGAAVLTRRNNASQNNSNSLYKP